MRVRKTKTRIREVTQMYVDEMKRRFPDLRYEIISGHWYGADAFVEMAVSPEEQEDAQLASVQVKFDLYDRTGISVLGTVTEHQYFSKVA